MVWTKNDFLNKCRRSETINESGKFRVHLFAGSEVDILSGGKLDFEDSDMDSLDYVVASVHAGLTQDEETMTARLLKVLEHPKGDYAWAYERPAFTETGAQSDECSKDYRCGHRQR
jgi:histidinol phosphatase-like PHP family hydrolase